MAKQEIFLQPFLFSHVWSVREVTFFSERNRVLLEFRRFLNNAHSNKNTLNLKISKNDSFVKVKKVFFWGKKIEQSS